MRANRLALLALIIGAAAVSGCDQARQTTGPGDGGTVTNCTGCHGGLDDDTGAPPRDLAGGFATTEVTVGAHSAHLAKGVLCSDCHQVPDRIADAGHMDDGTPNAEVRFSGKASLGGLAPAWNRAGNAGKGTCSNVYCHGASLAAADRGQATTPTWTGNPPALAGTPCGSCHGTAATNGAPSGHATNLDLTDCNNCHAGTVLPNGTIDTASGKHIDGTVQAEYGSCSSCHGDDTRAETDLSVQAAPPKDVQGATTGAKVGAHLRHLSTVAGLGSRLSRPFKCAECHVVPTTVPHNATSVVQFATAAGTLAKGPTGALNPTYSAASGTCNSVYCHGTGLLGGSAKNPAWTTTFASGASECGTCHFAANPPAPHPAVDTGGVAITATTQCIQCHPGTVLASGAINVDNGLHVNGIKDIDFHAPGYDAAAVHGGPAKLDLASCKVCHGADLNGLPASNNTSCNACHAANGASGWQTNCVLCHGESNRAADAAHDNVGTPPLRANKAAPPLGSQDETGPSSNAVGAHLAHIQAGQLAAAFKCQQCHGTSMPTDIGHVNGQIAIGWQLAATGATPSPAAGAYPRSGASTTPVSCANYCHGATLGGGSKKAANGSAIPVTWTGGAAEASCGTCHALPPPYAAPSWHVPDADCAKCHGYAAGNVNVTVHVNGLTDMAAGLTCASCHGTGSNFAPPKAATNGATLTSDARVGAHQAHLAAGQLANAFTCAACHGPTLPSTLNHANGVVTIGWSALATTGGVVATPTAGTVAPGSTASCANYCHGGKWTAAGATNDQTRGTLSAAAWTGGAAQVACGTCHKAPPTTGAHASVTAATLCSTCHTGYTCTTGNLATCSVNKTAHVNGTVESNLSCSSCHGTASRTVAAGTLGPTNSTNNLVASPPVDTQAGTTGVRVGAHLAHVDPNAAGGQIYKVVLCSECHGTAVNAYTVSHPNTITELTFANATGANLGGFTPSFTQAAPPAADTCATYCHGATFTANQAGTTTTWQWNTGISATCGSCHGAAPNDPAHTSVSKAAAATPAACNPCHNTVVSAAGAILFTGTGASAATRHIDGVVDVAGATCTSCHGSASNPAVALAAPPVATTGATTGVKVGAHQKHLTSAALRAGAAAVCTDCHAVPAALDHATGSVDLAWSAFVRTGPAPTPASGVLPAAWEATPTCTNYCHGSKWAATPATAGTLLAPSWTAGPAAAACGTCHKIAPNDGLATPAGVHPTVTSTTSCSNCHAGYACTSGNVAGCSVNVTTHINGSVEVVTLNGCASCHGTAGRTYAAGTLGPQDTADHIQGAPPVPANSVNGGTQVQVGPHQAHVNPLSQGAQIYKPLLCSECHSLAVNSFATSGHAALSPKVNFVDATGADLGGVAPTYTPGSSAAVPDTCITYCHGASLSAAQKGSITTWQWNIGIVADCGSCHAAPPADQFHTRLTKPSAVTTCSACHASVVNAAGAILFSGTGTGATSLHINGTREASSATCTSCHGTAGVNNAPPTATTGVTTGVKVGAHQKHLTGTTLRPTALICDDCHTVPAATAFNHADTSLQFSYAALASTGGLTPTPATMTAAQLATWEATPTCTNYCHGGKWIAATPATNSQYRGATTTPSWTGGAMNCGSCHQAPPTSSGHSTVTATTNCSGCHTGYNCTSGNLAGCSVNATQHLNGAFDAPVGGDCIGCHTAANGTRRAIVPEFALAWSHKRSAAGAVTKYDCAVCHMEGDVATGNVNSTYHLGVAGGVINLRDPDTGANIKGVTFTAASGASPGSYASTTVDATFAKFSRNLSVTLEADPNAAVLQAQMVNFCLKCHDADGATSSLARVPVSVMPNSAAAKPFGTTITGAAYTGTGVTAGGVTGGVTDVKASFATTNSSYHPVLGKQNNWYAKLTRMVAPWNAATRGGTVDVTSWGPLISCWDCHAGTGATGTLTATVTAHGGAVTLRGNATASGTGPTATTGATLCWTCHAGYDTSTASSHGSGSALSSSTNSTMTTFLRYGCNRCHASNYTTAVARPVRGIDVHGTNALPANGTKSGRWSTDPRPYAFIRNTTSLSSHQPARIGTTNYTPTCVHLADSPCNSRTETYTVGGTY